MHSDSVPLSTFRGYIALPITLLDNNLTRVVLYSTHKCIFGRGTGKRTSLRPLQVSKFSSMPADCHSMEMVKDKNTQLTKSGPKKSV